MRILLIEDEQRLAENIAAALREMGLAVDHASDGEAGSHLAEQDIYDAIMLDLMLPGKSGLRILQDLRRKKINTPVLILTAQEGKQAVVELLNAGADDYLGKPFDLGELLARVKALVRRGKGVATPVLLVRDLTINTLEQSVLRDGTSIDLSPTEYRILEYMVHKPKVIVSKRELLEHLYDYNWERHSNVIEAHVSNLRKKLDVRDRSPYIQTLRGRGYKLQLNWEPL